MQQSDLESRAYPMPSGIDNIETKQVYDNPADDPDYKPKQQCFGFTLALFFAIDASLIFAQKISNLVPTLELKVILCHPVSTIFKPSKFIPTEKIDSALECISYGLLAYFFAISFLNPKYVGGNPAVTKLWPILLALIIPVTKNFISKFDLVTLLDEVFFAGLMILIMYFIYIRNDASESCLLCLKPWVYVYKKKKIAHVVPEQVYGQGDPSQPTK